MHRNKFFQIAGLIPFVATTLHKQLFIDTYNRVEKGFIVEKGKDRFDAAITLMEGDTFQTKIATKDTDGDLFLFESTRIVNGGPPLHYHPEQDEWFYILEGEFLFKIGEMTSTLKAGDSAFGPRMVPHAFSKINDGPARMMIMYQPAGKMEVYFKSVSQGLFKDMNPEEKKEAQKQHGFVVTGPALLHEKK